jgi:hypothetical protein
MLDVCDFTFNMPLYRVTLLIETIFVPLATHLRFYVGTFDCQIQI